MKRKSFAVTLAFCLLTLSSCNVSSTPKTTISFYDGQNLLGSITGERFTKISDSTDEYDKLLSYQVKENTTFKGWYNTADLYTNNDKKVSVNYFPANDINLYGYFANNVTITLEKIDTDTINYPEGNYVFSGVQNDSIGEDFPIPTKTNYYFNGWKDRSTNEFYTSTLYPAENITLIPDFTIYPTISFQTNVDGYTIDSVYIKPGDTILDYLTIDDEKLKKDNAKFYGWTKDSNYLDVDNAEIFNLKSSMPKESFTLYAVFVNKRTITFDTSSMNNITIDPIVAYSGDLINPPSYQANFDKDLQYFDNWYIEGESEPFFKTNKRMPKGTSDITLVPKYLDKANLTINFSGNTLLSSYYTPGKSINIDTLILDNSTQTVKEYYESYATNNNLKFKYYTYVDNDHQTATIIENPNNFYINSSTQIELVFDSLTLVSFNFVDLDGNSLSNISTYSEYAYEYYENDTNLTSYLNNNKYSYTFDNNQIEKPYSIKKIVDSTNNEVNFPLQVSGSTTEFTCYLAKPVAIKLNVFYVDDIAGTNKTQVTLENNILYGNQQEFLDITKIDTTSSTYKVYGIETNISTSNYSFHHVDDITSGSEVETQLPELYPDNNQILNVYFVKNNI